MPRSLSRGTREVRAFILACSRFAFAPEQSPALSSQDATRSECPVLSTSRSEPPRPGQGLNLPWRDGGEEVTHYNVGVQRQQVSTAAGFLLVLLLVLFYPAFFLQQRVAPESALRASPPWRAQLGPVPAAPAAAAHASRHLGPRLALIQRTGLATALWNPFIGGGRGGWLSSPAEGGAPLPLLAVLLARPAWVWTALVALHVVAAFLSCFWLLTRQGLERWPAALGATVFAVAGPVSSQWLTWRGSAACLGPLLLLPAFRAPAPWRRQAARWGLALLLALACGPPALPFVAAGVVWLLFGPDRPRPRPALLAWGAGLALALATAVPLLWLDRASAEDGAALPPIESSTPARLLDLLRLPPAAPAGPLAAPAEPGSSLFVGLPALLLAGAALLWNRRRGFATWLGLFVAALGCAALPLPTRWLPAPTVVTPVLALAVAALVAFGGEGVLRAAGRGREGAVGAALAVALLASLLPAAGRSLPFVPAAEPSLPAPLPPASCADGSRMVALLDAVPPDSAAASGAADVRAADLRREPRYAAALGLTAGRGLSLTQALDPSLGRLGARWIVEPLPLRVVSASIFAAIETATVRREGSHSERLPLTLTLPPGTARVGVPASLPVEAVLARSEQGLVALAEDRALAGESDAWRWFAVPTHPFARGGLLVIRVASGRDVPELAVALDRSGLFLAGETEVTRLWERRRARPLVFVADAFRVAQPKVPPGPEAVALEEEDFAALSHLADPGGRTRVEAVHWTPARVRATVAAERPALLVVQVKYRPLLWRATVNGQPTATVRADLVWTGVPLSAGRSQVRLQARLPAWTLVVSLLGCCGIVALLTGRRKA